MLVIKNIKKIFCIIFILIPAVVFGSQIPPNPVCKITARVVEFSEEVIAMDITNEKQTHVNMKIEILSDQTFIEKGRESNQTCEQYSSGKIIEANAVRENDFLNSESILKENSIIKADIEYCGDETGTWYRLSAIESIGNLD